MQRHCLFALILTLFTSIGLAQSNSPSTNTSSPVMSDEDAIKQTALDYMEGWYEGNADRMERALSPDLAKRIVMTDAKTGRSKLDQLGAMGLVQYTRAGLGKKTPKENQIKNVKILDVFGNAASVRAEMSDWIDYMHMAKFNGQWKIVNVLWELKPKK